MQNLDIFFKFLSYEGTSTIDPADGQKIANRIQDTGITDISRFQFALADSVSDQTVNIAAATVDYLVVIVDREVSIKVNGSSDAYALKPRANGKKTLAFFYRGAITALTISNASGAVANVDILTANK